jgi:ferrous iron transport protein A
MTVKDMQVGEEAEILGFASASKQYRGKLLSMGLTKGTTIKLVKVAPLGDPIELTVRGFNLSLRKDEADILQVRRKV